MSYWSQQLNFAVWCATTGRGISRDIFDKNHSTLGLPPQVYSFYQFHVYFTVRQILYQLRGIQSISALPGDPTFSQTNNKYDVASYKRIFNEFGIDPSSDFRFTSGKNKGLDAFTSMFHTAAQKKPNMITPAQTNFPRKVVQRQKATLSIISIKIPKPKPRQTGFAKTQPKA